MPKLQDKVALVTGGTSGIGWAAARLFASEGARVTVTGSSAASVEKARSSLGREIEVLVSDARQRSEVEALVAGVGQRHGGIDVLFLNAGRPRLAGIESADDEGFDHMLDVNLKGPWMALRAALDLLRPGASVIFNTSIASVRASPGLSAYGAAKAGLRALARYAAAELAPRKIRVNSLSPGPIDTPAVAKLGLPAEQESAILTTLRDAVPLGRMGTPEEAARAALFLACDDSSFITGSELTVDGGATLR